MVNGWVLTPLGEILTERKETPSPESLDTGEVSIISKIGFNEGKIELRNETKTKTGMILIRPGDLVISGINAVKGAVAVYNPSTQKPIAATIHYGSYVPKKERVDISFLWWFLRSAVFCDIVQQYIPGGIKTELKAKRFLSVPIPLPPLTEQHHIVARIEELALNISKTKKNRQEAIYDTNALLSRVFDGILINGDFEYKSLKNVLAEPLVNGLSIPASGIGQEGILFAKVGIVNNGKMSVNETKRVNIELPNNSTFWMKRDDIFVSRGNSLELVGRAAVYEGKPVNCAFTDLLIRVRVEKTIIEPHYLVDYFQSAQARKYIESEASGTSPSMKKVSQPKLERMQIPIPPLDEQRRIVAYLDDLQAQVDQLRRLQIETQKELDALLPSILDKAFKGEL